MSRRYLFISDLHVGSIYFDYPSLLDMLNRMELNEERVDTIFVLGDLVEGKLNHKGQYYSAFPLELQQQLLIDVLRDLISAVSAKEVYIMPGNHDKKHGIDLIKSAILELMQEMRDVKIHYIEDEYFVYIDWETGKKFLLLHGIARTSGSDYLGLTPLILANILSIEESKDADLVVLGHYHKSVLIPYANKYILALASFQAMDRYLRNERIIYIVDVNDDFIDFRAYSTRANNKSDLVMFWSSKFSATLQNISVEMKENMEVEA